MARKRKGGLEYDAVPDLVQPGAQVHQDDRSQVPNDPNPRKPGPSPPKPSQPKKASRLEYDPEPFPGARAAAGPSQAAQETLRTRGLMGATRKAEGPRRARKPEKVKQRPQQSASVKRTTSPRTTRPTTPRRQAAAPRKTAPKRGSTGRTARTVRLAPNVEAKLQQIAASFGVDLNAAMAIAITHGFKALEDAMLVLPVKPRDRSKGDR